MNPNIETAQRIWNGFFREREAIDVAQLLTNEEVIAANQRLLAPGAPIEFATPDGGNIGEMGGPFTGADGLLRGWTEWVGAWQSFRVRVDEWLEPQPGVVLMLGHAWGRLLGSEAEVEVSIGAICVVRGRAIIHIQHFLDREQARRAAEAPGLADLDEEV